MIRALLVDDHAGMRHVVRRLLERSDDVEILGEAEDGEQALQEIDKLEPDVVLLDLMMPRVDGFAVLEALRSKSTRPKVVVLTMKASRDVREQALAAGANAFVPKRWAHFELVPTIRAVAG